MDMADYVKILFKLLLAIFLLLQCCLASEDPNDEPTCGFPGAPAYGYVKPDKDSYDDEDVVTFSCRVGHILLGAPISRCTEDGSWTEEVPICDDSMTTLGIASSTPTLPGHSAEMAIDQDRDTCAYMKGKKPRWWRIDLGNLHKVLSVAVTMMNIDKQMKFTVYVIEIKGSSASYKRCASFTGKFGSQTVVFACAEGKGLLGQRVHIEDYLQEGYFEICEVELQVEKNTGYDCGRPDRRPYSMTYDPEDGEVEYHCKTGYELVGDATRECLNTGHWSGEAPACKPIECDPLEDLENGELSYSDVDGDVPLEGSTAIYKCNYGYMLEGDFTRLCLKDGTWSGKDPVCRVIRCPIPEGKNDVELYRLLNRTNRVGSIAKLRCRKGVVVGDDPFMTCTVDGVWTEPKAQCLQPGGSTMPLEELPRIVNRGGVIFGMAVAVIMMVIILVSFYVVKRRRDANKPELPSRQNEPLAPPPRPPPRGKALKSALIELVSRDSSASKYESLNLEGNDEGHAAWKTRSLPTEPGTNNEGMRDELGSNRRTLSYDDPEKLTPRTKENAQQGSEKSAPPEEINRVATPAGEYAAVDYDKKRQSRLLKDSEERSLGASPVSGGEQLRELPPIPKEDEEEESRAQSTGTVRSEKSEEESEDVSLPIAPSETSEAPTPSPDVVIENQVEGPSASPSSPTSETTPGGRRRRRMTPEQPTPEEVTQPSRRRRSRADHAPSPEAAAASPAERARAAEPPSPEAAPTGRTRTRRRTAEREEPESPPPAPPVEEERPARRTRAAGRYDSPPSTTIQPSSRRRY